MKGWIDVDLEAMVASLDGSFAPVFSGGGAATVNGLSSSFLVAGVDFSMARLTVAVTQEDERRMIAFRCRIAPAASSLDNLMVARAR